MPQDNNFFHPAKQAAHELREMLRLLNELNLRGFEMFLEEAKEDARREGRNEEVVNKALVMLASDKEF